MHEIPLRPGSRGYVQRAGPSGYDVLMNTDAGRELYRFPRDAAREPLTVDDMVELALETENGHARIGLTRLDRIPLETAHVPSPGPLAGMTRYDTPSKEGI